MICSTFNQLFLEGSEIFGISDIVFMILIVASVIGLCFCFKKAGEKPWKAIIPIYNIYIMMKIAWSKKAFIGLLVCSLVTSSMYILVYNINFAESKYPILEFIYYLSPIFITIFEIITILIFFTMIYYFVKSFSKGFVYAIIMMITPFVVTFILAFGKGEFKGNTFEQNN